MPGESSFLRSEELTEFSKPCRFHSRHVVKVPLQQSEIDPAPEELTSRVVKAVKAITRSDSRSFQCDCVVVRADDGMSWSAESVRKKALAEFPQFDVVGLGRRESQDLPYITRLLGERRLLQAAVKHKLAKWYPTLSLPQASAVAAGVGIVGAIVAVGSAIVKVYTPAAVGALAQLKSPLFIVPSVVLALLGIVGKILADRLAPGQKQASRTMLKGRLEEYEKLASQQQEPKQYIDFIEALCRGLQWSNKPRIVIIDNYEHLDPTSRAVIEQYFRVQRKSSSSSEYWLILELPDGQGISRAIEIERERYEQERFHMLRQLPLDQTSIQELAQTLQLKEVPPSTTVKWICHSGSLQYNERTIKLLQEYRADHPANPEQYGDLEFFYFLSAASIPAEMTFERRELISGLIQGTQRLQILKLLLKKTKAGTEQARSEFDRRLTNIQRDFTQFVETNSEGELTFLHEPARIIEANAARLGLEDADRDAGLVHLYWSLYWHDRCQNPAPQAFLLRKLRCHLLKADIDKVPSREHANTVKQVFEALIYTIDNSLKTCLFDDLPKFTAKAADFYWLKRPQDRGNSQERLLRRCWEVFAVTGDQEVLTTILDLKEVKPGLVVKDDGLGSQHLTDLFLAVTPMDDDSRGSLRTGFQSWFRTYENGEAARNGAEAFAGWLISSMAPLVPPTGEVETLLGQASESLPRLSSCFHETCQRIGREKSSVPMMTDVMTLSLCLWAVALRIEDQIAVDDLDSLIKMGDAALVVATVLKNDLESLIEMAGAALVVATVLKDKTSGPHMEAVVNALSRELCAVTLASLLVGASLLKRAEAVGTEWYNKLQKLVADGLEVFGHAEQAAGDGLDLTASKLLSEVNAQLSLCALVWMRFGLNRLRDFAYLRRLQFNFICRGITPDDHSRMQPLLEPLSLALKVPGATSVLCDCSVASCLRAANDLSARYLNRASRVALKGKFDPAFRKEMAIMAIYHGHALHLNLVPHLEALLEEDANGSTALREFLPRLPGALISSYALCFLNVSATLRDQSAISEVERVVAEAANFIPDPHEHRSVLSLLELISLERRASSGEALPSEDELLAAWSDRQHLWMFATVMLLLIQKGHPRKNHWQLARSLLQHDPRTDQATSYFNLAMTVAEHIEESGSSPEEHAALLSYLQRSVTQWEKQVSVETNLTAYQLLSRLDKSNPYRYNDDLFKWQKIKIERDHIEHLPQLVEQKKYFLIFYEYYNSVQFWGLRNDGPAEDWRRFKRANTDERRELIANWIAEGSNVPAPLLGPQHDLVSARFLWVGYRLFSPPFYDDPKYEDYRKAFNIAARDALHDLSEAILQLRNLPREVHDLLTYHSRQLLSYAGVTEKERKRVRAVV